MLKKGTFIFCASAILILWGCGSENGNNTTPDSFNRVSLLTYYADSLIIPEYIKLDNKVNSLKVAVSEFVASPSENTLSNAKSVWKEAYGQWQVCSPFNFGPAQGTFGTLLEDIGTFPIRVTGDQTKKGIEEYIAAGDNSLNNFARDTRGFLGVEYLLYESESSIVIAKFTGDEGKKRRDYVMAILNDIVNKIHSVNTQWSSFRAEFINNNGTDAGSSTSELYNEFVKSFESLKNYKYGLPLGTRPGQTQSEPDKVEAYYSGTDFVMSKKHWESIERLWHGKTTNGYDGIGFEEYVASAVNGKDLVNSTNAQIQSINNAFGKFPASMSLSTAIVSNRAAVESINTELQKLTRFIKSDMSSLLGISITYSSGDGD